MLTPTPRQHKSRLSARDGACMHGCQSRHDTPRCAHAHRAWAHACMQGPCSRGDAAIAATALPSPSVSRTSGRAGSAAPAGPRSSGAAAATHAALRLHALRPQRPPPHPPNMRGRVAPVVDGQMQWRSACMQCMHACMQEQCCSHTQLWPPVGFPRCRWASWSSPPGAAQQLQEGGTTQRSQCAAWAACMHACAHGCAPRVCSAVRRTACARG